MRQLSSFTVGEAARIYLSLPGNAIDEFAALSGDVAPLHMDAGFARQAGFSDRVVHGAHLVALISRLLGTVLPGDSGLLERIDIAFRAPCYAPCDLIVEARVRQVSDAVSSIVLDISVTKSDGDTIATGKTWHRIFAMEEK